MKRSKKDDKASFPRFFGMPIASGIALVYLLTAACWIFFSDRLAESLSETREQLLFLSTYKGWVFVGSTALLLFMTLRYLVKRIARIQRQMIESEVRFEVAADAGGIGIWDRDILNDRLVWDDRMYGLYGIRPENSGGAYEAWQHCVHPDDLERTVAEVTEAERGGKPFDTEFRIIRPDGATRHIRAFGKVIRNAKGTPLHMIGTNQDITERVENEQRFRMLFETMHSGVAIYRPVENNRDFVFVDMNPAGLRYSHLSQKEVIGRKVTRVFPSIEKSGLLEVFRKVASTGCSQNFPLTQYKDARIEQWVENDVFRLPSGLIVAVFEDISEKQKVQEKLRIQANALDQIQDYVTVTDLAGRITYLNQAELNLLGKTDEELIGRTVEEFGEDPEQGATQQEIIKATLSQGVWRGEVTNWKHDGTAVVMDCRTQLMRDEKGTPIGMIGISTDITERLKAEKKLQESEEKLRSIIESSTNMFYSHTPEHVLTFVSPQVKDILGYEVDEALIRWTEMTTDHPINEQGFTSTEKAIRTGKAQPAYELQFRHKAGHPVWVEVHEAPFVENGKTVAIVGSLTDITKRKDAETELEQRLNELERFNKVAVGRELRMIELKNEINALCRELGRKEPYEQAT